MKYWEKIKKFITAFPNNNSIMSVVFVCISFILVPIIFIHIYNRIKEIFNFSFLKIIEGSFTSLLYFIRNQDFADAN